MLNQCPYMLEVVSAPSNWYTLSAIVIAACATIFAGLIWRESIKQRESEEYARRAYLGQIDEPGSLKKVEGKEEFRLEISFKNFGRNPANAVEITFLLFNSMRLEDLIGPDMHLHSVFSNIIPPSGLATTRATGPMIGSMEYIIAKVHYRDTVLDERLEEIFSWEVKEHILEETDLATREVLMQMAEKCNWQPPHQNDPADKTNE